MPKMTKIKLALITDPDMHIFFEKGTRGDKEKYVIHYENMKLNLRLELKLKKTKHIRIQSITKAKTIY